MAQVPVDVNRLLGILNDSKLITTNPPLYQVIKSLITVAQNVSSAVNDVNGAINGGGDQNLVLHASGDPAFRQVATEDIFDLNVTTAKIANSAVTYAKIQNVTANKLLGRRSGSSGVVEEVTIGSGLSMSALAVLTAESSEDFTNIFMLMGG